MIIFFPPLFPQTEGMDWSLRFSGTHARGRT